MGKVRTVGGYTNETSNLSSIANVNFNRNGTCTLANLRDGTTSGANGCDTPSDTGPFTLDVFFSSAKDIGKLRFYAYANTERLKDFVLYRQNGGSWTKVPITSITEGGTIINTDEGRVNNSDGWVTLIFDPVTDTGMRLVFSSVWGVGDNNAWLTELQIFSVIWS
jgi:hypothetical protein